MRGGIVASASGRLPAPGPAARDVSPESLAPDLVSEVRRGVHHV